MGQRSDQRLEGTQNRTLNDSQRNGVSVHLFEVFSKGKYTYQGRVESRAARQSKKGGALTWVKSF